MRRDRQKKGRETRGYVLVVTASEVMYGYDEDALRIDGALDENIDDANTIDED